MLRIPKSWACAGSALRSVAVATNIEGRGAKRFSRTHEAGGGRGDPLT